MIHIIGHITHQTPMRSYNNARTHRRFLHRLHSILPEGCCPVVVTDAGFRGPRFRDVEALGWDWIGRIRNRIKYLRPETGRWCYIHSLYPSARSCGSNSTMRGRSAGETSASPSATSEGE